MTSDEEEKEKEREAGILYRKSDPIFIRSVGSSASFFWTSCSLSARAWRGKERGRERGREREGEREREEEKERGERERGEIAATGWDNVRTSVASSG